MDVVLVVVEVTVLTFLDGCAAVSSIAVAVAAAVLADPFVLAVADSFSPAAIVEEVSAWALAPAVALALVPLRLSMTASSHGKLTVATIK